MSQQVQVPVAEQKSPIVLNVASFVRNHKLLKQRKGLFNGQQKDFFRYKRIIRTLLSPEYNEKQKIPKNGLPPIKNEADAQKMFISIIQNQLILPVEKLELAAIREKNLTPSKDHPTILPIQKAELKSDAYYMWLYEKPNPWLKVYSFLGLIGVFTVILFPLWPLYMRRGVWYLSMGLLGLICVFMGIAVVRLIVYVASLPIRGFWLFPNLFEDCGVLESFSPLYGWDGVDYSPLAVKREERKLNRKKGKNEDKPRSIEKIEEIKEEAAPAKATKKVTLEEVEE